MNIGAMVLGPAVPGMQYSTDARAAVEAVVAADRFGLDCAWVGNVAQAPDTLAILAAAAVQTSRIELGTSIYQIFPRHPVATAQLAHAIDQLAPGRLRLGLGTSHQAFVEPELGIPFERPLQYLREYLVVVNSLLQTGSVDFVGERITAHVTFDSPGPSQVRVLASALRKNAFRLCGELTDGAIAGVCPINYIHTVAQPAVRDGALLAGRPAPPVLAHMGVCVSTDAEAVAHAAQAQFGPRLRLTFYRELLVAAGFDEAADGIISDRMVDSLVIHGHADAVKEQVRALAGEIDELRAIVVQPAGDPGAYERTLATLGEVAREG